MKTEKRNNQIHFMMSDSERQRLEDNIKRAGIPNMGAYLRKMALCGYIIQMDLTSVDELVSLLRSVSNNMNQIARRANETRSIYEADIQDLRERYDTLWGKAEDILKTLAELQGI